MHHHRTEWKRFKAGGQMVEGRVIHPDHECGDLILFCPGYPGSGATTYEQRHAETVANEDFTQIILRHNGTILDGQHSVEVMNTRQFPNAQPFNRSGCLGGNAVTISDWLTEPQTILEDVGCSYTNIYILGHSFGSVAALNSLANLYEAGHPVMDRICACICLAPALGTVDGDESENIMRIWQDGYFSDELVKSRIHFAEHNDLQGTLRETYRTLPARVASISGKIHLTFLHVAKDEYIREKDIRDFAKACGHEGGVKLDEMDHAIPTHGGMDAHDMPVYPTELLLELIEPAMGLIDVSGIYKS